MLQTCLNIRQGTGPHLNTCYSHVHFLSLGQTNTFKYTQLYPTMYNPSLILGLSVEQGSILTYARSWTLKQPREAYLTIKQITQRWLCNLLLSPNVPLFPGMLHIQFLHCNQALWVMFHSWFILFFQLYSCFCKFPSGKLHSLPLACKQLCVQTAVRRNVQESDLCGAMAQCS